MKQRQKDGLAKRCTCSKPSACKHPWSFAFFFKTCGCRAQCDPSVRKAHRKQNHVRISLHKHANKPASYWMSKSEADAIADDLRTKIRNGEFPTRTTSQPERDSRITFGEVADRFFSRLHRRESSMAKIALYLRIIRTTEISGVKFEAKPVADVSKADLEAVRDARRAHLKANVEKRGRRTLPGSCEGEEGLVNLMTTLRDVFEFAIDEGHIDTTPFKRGDRKVIKVRLRKKQRRDRRLDSEMNEEMRLLDAARPKGRREGMEGHLYDVIVAALETGCRSGELLSLQWKQIVRKNGVMDRIDLPADKTKTNEPRQVPITSRLRSILEYRRVGVDGKEHGPEAHVFGDETGERVGRIYTAFKATCRRAGIADLRFHDLRHEFTSRALDRGVPLHVVRDWVGHRNIATTNIYANTTAATLDKGREQFEMRSI